MSHTPGPWITYDTGYGMRICPASVGDCLIPPIAAAQLEIARLRPAKELTGEAWDQQWEIDKANAVLMASAPEMLAALKLCLPLICLYPDGPWKEACEAVTAAVRKAEGES